MACFLWAQTWYGTFKRERFDSQTTQARLEAYALKSDTNADTAKALFLNLENIRLLSNIERALPGLYREMNLLSPLLIPQDNSWTVLTARLNKEGASVEDTFEVLDVLLGLNISFSKLAYQGGLNLDAVCLRSETRKENIVSKINNLLKDNGITKEQLQEKINTFEDSQSDTSEAQYSDQSDDDQDDLGALSENTQLNELIQALLQDVESIDLQDFEGTQSHSKEEGDDQSANINLEPEALFFDEWDYVRQNYRKSWCRLNLKPVSDKTEEDFKQLTDEKYPFLISRLKRIFEAMRDQPSMANRQTDGEEIDLDAVVEMHTARRAGEEISERLYIRRQQNKRSVAVCLLVDMSGSTKGWINLAMRESLILFSEALNTLGDEYAIYGFSGLTRQRCEIYDVKHFNENRLEVTQARIGNIQAKDYTRMGVAVRYATEQLIKIPAKHQILLMLSDGKPDDYDGYQGEYGIQDTRKAIVEAQSLGINPFSITIDKQAQLYLPRLFGPSQYMILNDVSMLPLKLSEVYRKLST